MEAKHTPGPWDCYEREARSDCWRITSEHDGVADLFFCREEDHAYRPYDEERAAANARLIAAAPDLLEALKAVLAEPELIYTGGIHEPLEQSGLYPELCAKIKAALAKVEQP